MEQYFRATPDVHYWELGIEENLKYRGHRKDWPYFWPNLEAKVRAVRRAAAASHTDIKLIYQIAETDPQTVNEFCANGASRQFDVLSLHPYAWPDFAPPEKWMLEYLAQVRSSMIRYNAVKPIWFTEIGAPLNGNPGGFFGYPSNPAFDRGLSRSEHASYMLKSHLAALRLGVQKVFWYNCRDGGSDPEYAEHHFGLIDYWGYPKPSYVAYSTMARLLFNKAWVLSRTLNRNVQVYQFTGKDTDCTVVWTYPAVNRALPVTALDIPIAKITSIFDLFGRPVSVPHGTLPLSANPVYICSKH